MNPNDETTQATVRAANNPVNTDLRAPDVEDEDGLIDGEDPDEGVEVTLACMRKIGPGEVLYPGEVTVVSRRELAAHPELVERKGPSYNPNDPDRPLEISAEAKPFTGELGSQVARASAGPAKPGPIAAKGQEQPQPERRRRPKAPVGPRPQAAAVTKKAKAK